MVLSLPAAELRCIIDFLPWWIRLSNTGRTSYICRRKKYKRRQMFAMEGVDSICLCSPPLPRLIHTELPTWFPITYISPALDRVDFLHWVLWRSTAQKRRRMETLSSVTSSHKFFTFTVTQIQQHGTRKTPLLIQANVQCCPKAYKI